MAASARFTLVSYDSGRVAQVIRPQVQANMEPRVDTVVSAAKAFAPVKTGRLKNSIRKRMRGATGRFSSRGAGVVSYEVLVAVPYAGFVVKGTAPHIIQSTGPWPLRNRETGQVFGPTVRHPGTKPNDFLSRALRMGFLRG